MKFAASLFGCFHPSTAKLDLDAAEEEKEEVGMYVPSFSKFNFSFVMIKIFFNIIIYELNHRTDVQAIPNPNFRVFSYNELKVATQGFKNKIGEGGFGSVYKVNLDYIFFFFFSFFVNEC